MINISLHYDVCLLDVDYFDKSNYLFPTRGGGVWDDGIFHRDGWTGRDGRTGGGGRARRPPEKPLEKTHHVTQ